MENRSVYSDSVERSALEVNKVLRNTYMLLSMTLGFSAVCAVVAMAFDIGRMASLGMMIGAFVTLFIVNKKAESASGLAWVFVFTGLMGASLGFILNMYMLASGGPELIAQALGGTAVVFLALSGYAVSTKKDFSYMAGFLTVGIVVVIVAALANLFFAVPAVSLAISAAIVFLMSGFILFDTSRIVNGGETNYIRATVGLYLNIYNLFTALLHLLGVFGSDD